jgi:hypothetical protein
VDGRSECFGTGQEYTDPAERSARAAAFAEFGNAHCSLPGTRCRSASEIFGFMGHLAAESGSTDWSATAAPAAGRPYTLNTATPGVSITKPAADRHREPDH